MEAVPETERRWTEDHASAANMVVQNGVFLVG
jgi:hypothetical protein